MANQSDYLNILPGRNNSEIIVEFIFDIIKLKIITDKENVEIFLFRHNVLYKIREKL